MIRRREPRRLEGRVAIITGASSGLGRELALALAAADTKLVLAARRPESLEDIAERCRAAGAEALAVPTDVTADADCAALCQATVAAFGRIDMVIACAGLGMWARLGDISDVAVLHRVMDVNYWGMVQPVFHALPHLRESQGMVVAVSSVQGRIGVPWHSGYAAAKHAVQGFCDSLRMEEEPRIEVMTVLAHWLSGTGLRARALNADGQPRAAAAAAHGPDAVPVEVAARHIVAAIRGRRRDLWIPRHLRALGLLAAIAPSLMDRLIRGRVERENARKG